MYDIFVFMILFQFVYFFFRELAIEDAGNHYSRVARICKSDKGGTGHSANVWTSFVKGWGNYYNGTCFQANWFYLARLNCSIPGRNRPFYFDEVCTLNTYSLYQSCNLACVNFSIVQHKWSQNCLRYLCFRIWFY